MPKQLLCALVLAMALTACGGADEPVDTQWTPAQMAQALWDSQPAAEALEILPGDEMYPVFLEESYGLAAEDVVDGAVFASADVAAQEFAVLRLSDTADEATVQAALEAYLAERAAVFYGYLPDEAALLEASEVVVRSRYAALLACGDVAAAREAWEQCFTEPPPADSGSEDETPPETAAEPAAEPSGSPAADSEPEADASAPEAGEPWSYDEARLLEAWQHGGWTELPPEDQAILEACAAAIQAVTTPEMTDYEKELALHDWLLEQVRYDDNSLSQWTLAYADPNNDNPYGPLVNGLGICYGYASTFQLLMQMVGIECITVHGTARSDRAEHAWNQVLLDGQWYCVDVTWDDPTTDTPLSDAEAHRYFNVTSDFLRQTSHQWDAETVPEATATAYAWQAA